MIRHNASAAERQCVLDGENRCSACNEAYRNVRRVQKEEVKKVTTRKRRLDVSSTYPMKYLSPASKKKRIGNVIQSRKTAMQN